MLGVVLAIVTSLRLPACGVEPKLGCRNTTRLGPFATREEAARALDTVDERNEAWDNDPRFNDPDEDDDEDDDLGSAFDALRP